MVPILPADQWQQCISERYPESCSHAYVHVCVCPAVISQEGTATRNGRHSADLPVVPARATRTLYSVLCVRTDRHWTTLRRTRGRAPIKLFSGIIPPPPPTHTHTPAPLTSRFRSRRFYSRIVVQFFGVSDFSVPTILVSFTNGRHPFFVFFPLSFFLLLWNLEYCCKFYM